VEAMLAGEQLDLVSIATPTATRSGGGCSLHQVTDEEMEAINIARNHFHGEWN
jgi:hypothetical protein